MVRMICNTCNFELEIITGISMETGDSTATNTRWSFLRN